MTAYVVCMALSGRAIEVLGAYVDSADAARACDKSGTGAHVVRGGALLRYHGRTARPVIVAIEKALREKTHPALAHQCTPVEPAPEPESEAAPAADELDVHSAAAEAPLEPNTSAEALRAADAVEAPANHRDADDAPVARAAVSTPKAPRPAAKRASKPARRAPKKPRKAARRVVRGDAEDATLSDLATILRQVRRAGSIARMLSDAELGRAVREVLEAQG